MTRIQHIKHIAALTGLMSQAHACWFSRAYAMQTSSKEEEALMQTRDRAIMVILDIIFLKNTVTVYPDQLEREYYQSLNTNLQLQDLIFYKEFSDYAKIIYAQGLYLDDAEDDDDVIVPNKNLN